MESFSQDPIGFNAGDPNLYRYVENQATNAVDYHGLDTWLERLLRGATDYEPVASDLNRLRAGNLAVQNQRDNPQLYRKQLVRQRPALDGARALNEETMELSVFAPVPVVSKVAGHNFVQGRDATTEERVYAGAAAFGPLSHAVRGLFSGLRKLGKGARKIDDVAEVADSAISMADDVAPNRVGQSELGNALSGLGSNPLTRNLNSLDEFGSGAGFSGVFDVASGKFLAYPSGTTRLANGGTPLNVVARVGGHRDVNRVLSELLGNTSNNRLGFSMTLDDAGDFAVRFNSGQVNIPNPNFVGRTVPESMRQQILDAIKAATGRGAYSTQ